jgi:S-DNA-T family DNA segregation ATPase FtsK/SpoIIIE
MLKKPSIQEDRRLEILGILLLAISAFIFVSLLGYDPSEEPSIMPSVNINNPMGILGVVVSHVFIKLGFGYVSFILPSLGIFWGWVLFSKKDKEHPIKVTLYSILLMMLLSISIGVVSIQYDINPSQFHYSGVLGGLVADLSIDMFSIYGCVLFMIACYLMLIRAYFDLDFYKPFVAFKEKFILWKRNYLNSREKFRKEEEKRKHTQELKSKIKIEDDAKSSNKNVIEETTNNKDDIVEENDQEKNKIESPDSRDNQNDIPNLVEEDQKQIIASSNDVSPSTEKHSIESFEDLHIEKMAENEELDIDEVEDRKKPKRKYRLPSSDLLSDPINVSDMLSRDELVDRANYLTQSLATYGVEGKVVNVHPGPVITLFEVEPAEGVRVNKFVQLADDLARVMEASNVRVIAPIPGKSSVGIEIPNRNPATVYFKSIVNSPEFAESESMLTLAIGKTTSGEISTLDLSKMPHLLIAGTTGSGKSVCINTIICSILYHATPDEVKFVMIDPKKVEMTLFKNLEGYHLLKMEDINEPIVTSVDNAILALRALEKEMDRRYNVLAGAVVRNISEYNEKMEKIGESIMPYIVLIVDELADLMMQSAKDVEAPIARLAQLARAVGIHLVIATQRPSVDVITGVIKANFPSRIAFQVASKIDSRTIIDQPGADKLIGRGDMLHLGTGSSDVIRMHNAFLTLNEIKAIMEHISDQPKSDEIIIPSVREALVNEYGDQSEGSSDDLFEEAISLVVTHQQGSISLLQRRLKVGYSRAARLIDEMEQAGIVGPFTGSKAREVLVDETYLEIIKE